MAELPILFRQQMLALLPDEADALLQALQTEPSVAVRVNRRKAMPPATDNPVAWCRSGIYLDARRQFTFDPLLHSGCYYVQDASSMFISHVLSQVVGNSPVAYLDLCAAPGGKTTAAIDALPDGSLVVANEIDSRRAQILRENVVKWGYPHCVVTNSDASRLGKLHEAFDIVAADMPCSGEGMMRKDDEAVAQWTPALVEQCAARQREIASDIWQALKPGGIFIYSTCTFNRAENEDMVDFLVRSLGAEPVDIVSDPSWGIHKGVDTPYPCFRFMPHLTRGEGLFMAVVRKNGEYAEKETKKDKNKGKKTSAKGVKGVECPKWIDGIRRYDLRRRQSSSAACGKDCKNGKNAAGGHTDGSGKRPRPRAAARVVAKRGSPPGCLPVRRPRLCFCHSLPQGGGRGSACQLPARICRCCLPQPSSRICQKSRQPRQQSIP